MAQRIVDGNAGGTVEREAVEWRPYTVPNAMSFIRLLCIPVFVWILFGLDDRASAAILLAALGSTDWVDGWFARKFNQVSELGKILDPSADRLLMLTAIIATWVDGAIPWWFAVLTLIREGLVFVAALGLGIAGVDRIDVTWWGKTATFFLLFAYPLLLGGVSDVGGAEILRLLGWITGIPGLVISWYAALAYIPIARDALRSRKTSAVG